MQMVGARGRGVDSATPTREDVPALPARPSDTRWLLATRGPADASRLKTPHPAPPRKDGAGVGGSGDERPDRDAPRRDDAATRTGRRGPARRRTAARRPKQRRDRVGVGSRPFAAATRAAPPRARRARRRGHRRWLGGDDSAMGPSRAGERRAGDRGKQSDRHPARVERSARTRGFVRCRRRDPPSGGPLAIARTDRVEHRRRSADSIVGLGRRGLAGHASDGLRRHDRGGLRRCDCAERRRCNEPIERLAGA
jgi:hypothetical protein